MNSLIHFLVLTAVFCLDRGHADIWLDPDTGLNWYQFIANHGYYYENYTLTTEDGYVLSTVRIPYGRNENATKSNITKPAVLLLHGIWSNPEDLIISGDTSIGFLLVESGFDVFLMASRGNTYSNTHVNLSTDSVAYWNFSWHEIGYYDIPTNMDLITNVTGNTNVSFIGHSQGGTAFVAFAATRPEYLERITVAHLFAPIVYMTNTRLPISFLIENVDVIQALVTDLQLNKGLFTYTPLVEVLGIVFCARDAPTVEVCVDLLGIQGPDPDQLNTTLLTVMATNDPAGGSFKEVFHYLQITDTGIFRQYDYGSTANNQLVYNADEPPLYNLTTITDVPINVWYGLNDYFSGALDYQRLISEIPSAIEKQVSNILWNHIDFAFAIQGPLYVYDEVVSNIQLLTKKSSR